MEQLKQRWNRRYRTADVSQARPAQVLAVYRHLLPGSGRALDLAAGLGGNAQLLAGAGLSVEAWDIADAAMDKLEEHARARGLDLTARVRDVSAEPPQPESFDVIVVSRFLERRLAPALVRALRPGGLLYYQTFVQEAVSGDGPANPEFRLAPNELLQLFCELHLLVYREEGRVGEVAAGFRDEAMLIGQRR